MQHLTFPNPRTEYGGFSYQLDDMYAFDCINAVRRMWLIIWFRGPTALKIDRYILILLAFFSLNAFANGNPQITGTVAATINWQMASQLLADGQQGRANPGGFPALFS